MMLYLSPRILLAVLFSVLPFASVLAEVVQPASATPDYTMPAFYFLAGVVLLVFVVMLLNLLFMLKQIQRHLEGNQEVPVIRLTDSVPIEREHEIMLDHDYDGIRELDNSLPPWWVAMFYITIVFGVMYMTWYHILSDGNVQESEYRAEVHEAEEQMKLKADKVDENNVTLLTDAARLKSGEAIFMKNCSACHGKLGEGGVGPNLTDNYWLHGGDIKHVFKTIKYGVPAKGMISWKAQLSPAQIQEVASYVESLKGTNPPNGKEPQGEMLVSK